MVDRTVTREALPDAPVDGPRRPVWANSVVAFVLAATVTVLLHEGAHAVAGLLQGATPVYYPFQADFPEGRSAGQEIVTAAAGPLFSLVLGLIVLASTRNAGRGFGRLAWLWFGCFGVQNLVGYLIITPFGNVGDTGTVLARSGAPHWVGLLALVVGLAGFVALAWYFLHQMMRYVRDVPELRAIGLLAWLAGTAVVVARTLAEFAISGVGGPSVPVVLAGAVSVGIFAPLLSTLHGRVRVPYEELDLRRPVVPAVVTVVLLVLVLVLVAPGIPL